MCNHIVYSYKFSTDINQFQTVAEDESLSKTDLRIFLFLCCRVGSQHYTKIDKSQIAETLGIPKKKVVESLEHLESHAIITKGSDDHAKGGYKMTYTAY